MKPLGTIFATPGQLAAADRFADRASKADRAAALTNPELADTVERTVGGERRYYLTGPVYATARNGRVRWFETRADGDYSLKARPDLCH